MFFHSWLVLNGFERGLLIMGTVWKIRLLKAVLMGVLVGCNGLSRGFDGFKWCLMSFLEISSRS